MLEFDAESGFVVQLATVALIVILFRDGIEVEGEMLQREWRLPARKLILAMPITCVLIALVTHAVTDLTWTESFLLGALLSPTDPVLSSSVVTNPRVPRLRPPLAQPRVGDERRARAARGARLQRRAGRPARMTSSGTSSCSRMSRSASPSASAWGSGARG